MKHARAEPAQRRLDVVLEPDDAQRLANLNGPFDAHLRQIELRLGVEIRARGNRFRLIGPEADIDRAENVLRKLFAQAEDPLSAEHVHLALAEQNAAPAARSWSAPSAAWCAGAPSASATTCATSPRMT